MSTEIVGQKHHGGQHHETEPSRTDMGGSTAPRDPAVPSLVRVIDGLTLEQSASSSIGNPASVVVKARPARPAPRDLTVSLVFAVAR